METIEREQLILEALELIQQAQEMVDEAVSGTNKEAHYMAYGRYGFDQLLGNGNPYDYGLESLMKEEE